MLTPERAIESIPDGATVVVSPACGTPTSLLAALLRRASGRGWTILSGLIFDAEDCIDALRRGEIAWRCWHPTSACAEVVTEGRLHYIPLRASRIPAYLAGIDPGVALVRVSPPDRHGWCSLGPSVSYVRAALHAARFRIAEVDPSVPRTWGDSMVHVSELQVLCDSTQAMARYTTPPPDETSRAIARHLVGLLPDRPVLQIGIGRIPETFLHELGARGIGGLRFVGMACDPMVDLASAGLLDREGEGIRGRRGPAIQAPDLLGTNKLMEWADNNPAVGVYPSTVAQDPVALAQTSRLVSINSAVEVDWTGQVNAEVARGRRISGVGGSLDFVEAATHSPGGLRVIAIPASRIVERLGDQSTVSLPRAAVDTVVTELGVARLEGLSTRERQEAMVSIAGGEA